MKKDKLKSILPMMIALCLMTLTVGGVIAYQKGMFEISFIDRNKGEEHETDDAKKENHSKKDAETDGIIVTAGDNINDLFNPDDIAENTDSDFGFDVLTDLVKSGYTLTDDNYSPDDCKIALVDTGVAFNTAKARIRYVYNGCYLFDYDGDRYILDNGGNVILSVIGSQQPAGFCDSEGHSIWKDREGNYYYPDYEKSAMVKIGIDENLLPLNGYDDSVVFTAASPTAGLRRYYVVTQEQRKIGTDGKDVTDEVYAIIESAIRYGKDVNDPDVYATLGVPEYTYEEREKILYGYVRPNGSVFITAKYEFATDFNEQGYALVSEENGALKMIDERGRSKIGLNSRMRYPDERNRRAVWEDYYFPEDFGIASCGMYSFDCGYIRMRYMQYDYKKVSEVVQDYYVLVNEDGERFEIPNGYTLEGYSEGVMLLKKDNLYGMMDITGKWIIQPVYTYATPFIQGLAVIGNKGKLYAAVDVSGNVVLPFSYDKIFSPSGGVFAAHNSDGWTLYNIMKKSASEAG